MGTLFRYELKKLLSRKLWWLFLGICLALFALPNKTLMSDKLQGRVQGMRDIYAQYEGRVLTDALAGEARADFENFVAAHEEQFRTFDDGEGGRTDYFPTGYSDYYAGAWQAFMDVVQGGTQEINRERAAMLQGFLDSGRYDNGKPLTQSDRARLASEIAYLGEPPVVQYAEGWKELEQNYRSTGVFPLFLLALCLAPLFSGERAAKMEAVMLCAAKKKSAAAAKLLAALSVALTFFLLFYGLLFLIVALTYGLDGARLSAFDNWLASYSNRTLSCIFSGVAFAALASLLASAFMVAFSSAAFRHTAAALLVYAAFIAVQFGLVNICANSFMWGLGDGPAWETISRITYSLPGNVLFDSNVSQVMILSDPWNLTTTIAVSSALAMASAAFAPALYMKRRKA
jgi:hypothetical protein